MARKDNDDVRDADDVKAEADPQVQAAMDVATEQGFIGTKVDPLPNEAYSLESGPESPTTVEQQASVLKAASEAAK